MELKIVSPKYGEFTVLYDDEDHEKVSKYKWCVRKMGNTFYVRSPVYKNKKQLVIPLHRLIMNFPEEMQVDHINHNGLDNRKCNLRICTNQQNGMNRKSFKNSSSMYKGVSWHKQHKKWTAQIQKNTKKIYLGLYENEKDAALAYNKSAMKMFGDFAYLNIIE